MVREKTGGGLGGTWLAGPSAYLDLGGISVLARGHSLFQDFDCMVLRSGLG